MKRNATFIFLGFVILFLSGISESDYPVKKITIIPPNELALPSQVLEYASCQVLFSEGHTDIVQYKVTDLGVRCFVTKSDTIRKRIGLYPHVGEHIAYSILCWQAVEESSDEWFAPKPHNGHVEESFLQYFSSMNLHFGWATELPILETDSFKEELAAILNDSIWHLGNFNKNDTTNEAYRATYLPVVATFSLYQTFFNSPWIRKILANRLETYAETLFQRKLGAYLTMGAIESGRFPEAFGIEISLVYGIVHSYSNCSSAFTPTLPYLDAMEVFNTKLMSLSGSLKLAEPPWCGLGE